MQNLKRNKRGDEKGCSLIHLLLRSLNGGSPWHIRPSFLGGDYAIECWWYLIGELAGLVQNGRGSLKVCVYNNDLRGNLCR